MNLKLPVSLTILLILSASFMEANAQSYAVEREEFNSSRYADFSPVHFRDGMVFCSNRKHDILVVYASPDNLESSSMWFVPLTDSAEEKNGEIFSEELLTSFHDGPATFNREGTVIYYSRNIDVDSKLRDVFDQENQLGLYRAELADGIWSDITPFKYNSTEYSLTTPALSHDGSRIYFASNMPGGFGGADLYYCDFTDGQWQPPVNLGHNVNSTGNESYPFESEAGILYFSSDGWVGFGKKDSFFTS